MTGFGAFSRTASLCDGGTLHRNLITTADLVAAPGNPTLTDRSADGGVLTQNTNYKVGVASVTLQPGSGAILGISPLNAAIQNVTTAADANNAHTIRVAWAQVTSADGYLIFLSTDAAPKVVGYVTEAQRATGGRMLTEFTYSAGGVAGSIDVGVVGTGIQTSNSVFTNNNAHLLTGISAINCAGYSKAFLHINATISKTAAWTAAPAVTVLPWLKDQGGGDYFAAVATALTLLTQVSSPMQQVIELTLNGAVGLLVTFPILTGVASVTCRCELV